MSPESIVKSAAALVLRMQARGAEWSTILNGLNTNVEVVRSRRTCPMNSHVRVHLHSECIR
jgi:hypothetical protein